MTDTERITNAVCERHEIDPLPLRNWTSVHQAELEDQARYVNEYPLDNLIMERKHRRMNNTTLFLVFTLILYAVLLVIFH
jgi:predicted nucleic acid-binding Zn ribbon protein